MKLPKWIIFLLIIGIGFAFYWYSIRPSSIRKECHQKGLEWAVQFVPFEKEPDIDKRDMLQDREYEAEYERCLRKNGISQ
ncbi:hypothetical protein A3A64_01885 [Candidatus Gottesmanbacteria bacterium RIFCSPLOWO2_01_FULL_48_11]|uniref:Uncharacterized protein n=2 Tax=Candidatus Gottesmaniibacteriota TaxID=1752720 RepID=A0A0G1U184_9BACT|nr:MAG: hypothetical protein UY16_C0018G0014 [Candidatus Gottesmanbacteria bacterium GW2011_GWA2_47_9]OGG28346.1 MAG: hypothetical protein A3A64_01885 [Candidatus Gottesmanbacteria bacterium RIFCSPLOWO2_01_FULL_48_11]